MTQPLNLLGDVCTPERNINLITLESVLLLALEIGREGREGRKIGTLFVVSDADEVLKRSKSLILDPVQGHPDDLKRVDDPNMRQSMKALAQLDGAFIVSDDGIVVSACRYIDASSHGIDLPLGFGTRHMAAASISKETNAVAVAVSETSIVRVFDDGELVAEIIPELWMLSHYGHHVPGPHTERTDKEVTVVCKTCPDGSTKQQKLGSGSHTRSEEMP